MSQLLQISVLLAAGLLGADPTVQQLQDGIHNRIREFRNLEFEYKVDATFWPSSVLEFDSKGNPKQTKPGEGRPKVVNSKDVFRILDSSLPDTDRPWRFWKKLVEEKGNWVMDAFLTYDGKHTSVYNRRETDSDTNFHSGAVIPFESTQYYEDNIFDRFLCTDYNGLMEYADLDWKLSKGIDNQWKSDGTTEFEGQTAYVLHGQNRYVNHSVHVIGFPHFLVIRRVVTPLGKPDAEPLAKWVVSSVGEINDRLYPSAGTFTQASGDGIPRIEYSFHVTAAKPLDESVREHWRPEWPSGTVVRDQVDNQNITIPHAVGERDKIQAQRSQDNKGQPPSPPGSRRLSILMVVNISVLLILFSWWAIGRIRSGRNSSGQKR